MPTQHFQYTLSGHANWVRSCAFSGDNRLAVSGGDDKVVRLWDLSTKKQIKMYGSKVSAINTVAFHPEGKYVASGGTDASIRIWDVRTDTLMQLYKDHKGPITGIFN